MLHRPALLVAALAATAVACGGSGEASPTTRRVTPESAPATMTAGSDGPTSSATETTALSASATTTTVAPPTTVEAATTTAVPAVMRVPLTGQPLGAGDAGPNRSALVVKIDNVGRGRPQTGLNQADIVFEEVVEGRATRFAAVFHSQGANPVGPIRSGRTQDVDLLSGLNQPIFVWSGGNPGVERIISQSGFHSLNASGDPPAFGFFRSDRPRPHNLFANTDLFWQQLTWAITRPGAMFSYVEPGTAVGGEPRSWLQVRVGTNPVRWDYDAGTDTYVRSQGGGPHQLTDGRASADNVIVLITNYRPSSVDARSPEAVTVGNGIAFVMSDGKLQTGVWQRADRTSPIDLRTPEGAPILIAPGRTWVELADTVDHNTQSG
jgi:hypothetical protein